MSSDFRRQLRSYAVGEIGKPGQHNRAELAAAFLDEHQILADSFLRDLAERQVGALIKEMCDEDSNDAQLALFGGFPTAIAIGPGVVKAIKYCTLDDLGAGLIYREQNVLRAQKRLDSYVDSMKLFDSLRQRPDETVGEVAHRLQNGHAA